MNKRRQTLLTRFAETHRANMRRSVEHRLKVARQQGDQALVQALEAEYKQVVS